MTADEETSLLPLSNSTYRDQFTWGEKVQAISKRLQSELVEFLGQDEVRFIWDKGAMRKQKRMISNYFPTSVKKIRTLLDKPPDVVFPIWDDVDR